MQRERVADDIYVFTSDQYAQVTAGVVVTSEGAILIDTLVFPEETKAIKTFVEQRLGCPVKYFVDGSYDDFVNSLHSLQNNNFENVVQGHGEVVLRGEIEEKIQNDLDYLAAVKKQVEMACTKSDPQKFLDSVDIEQCGKSRIP